MQSHLVFTVISKDRPGLVDRLADAIASAGGNWVESSMARLGGEFAGIVSVDIDTASLADLEARFAALEGEGFSISRRSGDRRAAEPEGKLAHIDLVSQDHPGILRKVTRVLADHQVSIELLETAVVPGSMSGEALFKATADLRLPVGLSQATLAEALQATAADMMADINLID